MSEGARAGCTSSGAGVRGTQHPTDGEAVDFVGKEESGEQAAQGNKQTPSSNINATHKAAGHADQTSEGKPVGTGKNTKSAPVNTKSTLGQSSSPRGK